MTLFFYVFFIDLLQYCAPSPFVSHILSLLFHLKYNPFSYPYPTKWGRRSVQHIYDYFMIKIRQLFLRPAACLTSNLIETGVGETTA
jgi:hypothetical protein